MPSTQLTQYYLCFSSTCKSEPWSVRTIWTHPVGAQLLSLPKKKSIIQILYTKKKKWKLRKVQNIAGLRSAKFMYFACNTASKCFIYKVYILSLEWVIVNSGLCFQYLRIKIYNSPHSKLYIFCEIYFEALAFLCYCKA